MKESAEILVKPTMLGWGMLGVAVLVATSWTLVATTWALLHVRREFRE